MVSSRDKIGTMNQTILFDIDRTLIDTDKLIKATNWAMADRFGRSIEETVKVVDDYVKSLNYKNDYYPKDLAIFISNKWKLEPKEVLRTYWNKTLFSESIFEDTEKVLNNLKRDCLLGIFSEGYRDFQSFKLEANGINGYFRPEITYIKRRKMNDNFVNNWGEVTVIDDDLGVVDFLVKFKKVEVVWINRKDKTKHPKVRTIFSLEELR